MFNLLEGVRIIDLTTVVLGPYATQLLGDLGAEVIKVESPEGDVFRAARPGRTDDIGAGFLNFNRNKQSVVLDLKEASDRESLYALIKDADVVVHNMRDSSARRLNIDYETLKAHKEDIVYCFSPGFGSSGPDADAPAYDDIIQARSGLASLNADRNGEPQFVRTIACDKVVGLHLALATASGIAHKARTGEGVCIEAPMLESMTSFLMAEHLAGMSFEPPLGPIGYDRLMTPYRKPHKTKDSYLAILPYSTKHWIRFFNVCEESALAEDPRVTDPLQRSEHIDWLYQEIARIALTKTTNEWLEILEEEDIPCAPINDMDDLFNDTHLASVELFESRNTQHSGQIRNIRSPFVVNGQVSSAYRPDLEPPRLGEHSGR